MLGPTRLLKLRVYPGHRARGACLRVKKVRNRLPTGTDQDQTMGWTLTSFVWGLTKLVMGMLLEQSVLPSIPAYEVQVATTAGSWWGQPPARPSRLTARATANRIAVEWTCPCTSPYNTDVFELEVLRRLLVAALSAAFYHSRPHSSFSQVEPMTPEVRAALGDFAGFMPSYEGPKPSYTLKLPPERAVKLRVRCKSDAGYAVLHTGRSTGQISAYANGAIAHRACVGIIHVASARSEFEWSF